MPFAKGKSGNPKGRPPKARALATLLEKAAKARPDVLGGRSNKDVFAEKIWQALTTGVIEYPPLPVEQPPPPIDTEGLDDVWANALTPQQQAPQPYRLYLETRDFIRLAKVVLTHLDGPVQAANETNVNVNGGSGAVTQIVFNNVPGRTEPPALDDLAETDDDFE